MRLGDGPSAYVKHGILSSFLKPYFPIPIWTAISPAITQRTCHSIDIVHTELFTLFFSCNDLGEFSNISSGAYCSDGYKALTIYFILSL